MPFHSVPSGWGSRGRCGGREKLVLGFVSQVQIKLDTASLHPASYCLIPSLDWSLVLFIVFPVTSFCPFYGSKLFKFISCRLILWTTEFFLVMLTGLDRIIGPFSLETMVFCNTNVYLLHNIQIHSLLLDSSFLLLPFVHMLLFKGKKRTGGTQRHSRSKYSLLLSMLAERSTNWRAIN